jgi:hypothetical protein
MCLMAVAKGGGRYRRFLLNGGSHSAFRTAPQFSSIPLFDVSVTWLKQIARRDVQIENADGSVRDGVPPQSGCCVG